MSEALRSAILEVPEEKWQAYGEPDKEVDRECAEVVFVPSERSEHKAASRFATSPSGCGNDREGCLPTAVRYDISPC
jgi:hypothetical protein